jgi:hypothetical protein
MRKYYRQEYKEYAMKLITQLESKKIQISMSRHTGTI